MQTRLKANREYQGISNKEMAELIGVHEETYKRKENGHLQFKSNEMFIIARRFNMKVDDIFSPPEFTS